MSVQALEDCAGQGTGRLVPGSLQRDEEDGSSGSELEQTQALGTPGLPSLRAKAPWGAQVCLHPWGEGVQLAPALPLAVLAAGDCVSCCSEEIVPAYSSLPRRTLLTPPALTCLHAPERGCLEGSGPCTLYTQLGKPPPSEADAGTQRG